MCYYKWLHSHASAIVWLMLSSLFLAKSTGFVLYKCVLWLQSRSCFASNFCYLTLSSMCWNQGLNFTKFFTPWSCFHYVLWLQSRSCFAANFCYLTLSSVCWNQGLNFAKFFKPWSFFHYVLWLQSRSCFTAIF